MPKPNQFYIWLLLDGFVPVKGTPVEVEGGFDIFAHRHPTTPHLWQTSEGTTGSFITAYHRTRKGAIQATHNWVAKYGVEFLQDRIATLIAKYGLSPRYADAQEGEISA